jgi:hypothetical protein
MLGVLVAEAWPIGSPGPFGSAGPIATAMVDLARRLTRAITPRALGEVADLHDGAAGPAWLLPLALAHPEAIELPADALELASRTHVPNHEVNACTAYVHLAAQLVAEQPVPAAIATFPGLAVPAEQPLETGHPARDALALGIWAVAQSAAFGEQMGKLAATSSPSVTAAAGGLLGLRDGLDAIPDTWYRHLDLADACLALAPSLHQTRQPAPALTSPDDQHPGTPTSETPTSGRPGGHAWSRKPPVVTTASPGRGRP